MDERCPANCFESRGERTFAVPRMRMRLADEDAALAADANSGRGADCASTWRDVTYKAAWMRPARVLSSCRSPIRNQENAMSNALITPAPFAASSSVSGRSPIPAAIA